MPQFEVEEAIRYVEGLQHAANRIGDHRNQAICNTILAALRPRLIRETRPVALAHVRLEDTGLEADLEVLDGSRLQPEHSPVGLYLAPPAGRGDSTADMPADLLHETAAAMWKQDAKRAHTPKSVIDSRTAGAFAEQSEDTRKQWLGYAEIALNIFVNYQENENG